ncbi:hypothetical protein SPRG_08530 [Saprolegnia parasitica CBS 223.65]|uniref:Uncharacterized protein n=1 Tax=Saprolegnia parasitica (strain CBS 223.65) TaxID=695850 RepID=A0A067C603_SAPPC|nr:hypothetical protein SPRG_08530 [Saprolegnia parasitica CBS 223.65]KDO26169.1 hypothetical protein SPRG_08530 [Saprolegnia parasitica CBS 223.65]|eukprot:XP_012203163.1 hypothetical protein SPRG_08530 [Saprolegnia parasitica CBS 223.65]
MITKACLIPKYPESKHKLRRLDPIESAELMLFWIQRRQDHVTRQRLEELALSDETFVESELQQDFALLSLQPSSSPRHVRELATHPILLAANGNPQAIVRLAIQATTQS